MPHAELKYSADMKIDAAALLAEIEQVIQRADAGSGDCKGRAYPADVFHHTHCLLSLSMLTKPHRDKAFTDQLLQQLETAMRKHLLQPCFISLGIEYTTDAYVTARHDPTASS